MIRSGRRAALRLLQLPPLSHALRLLARARGHSLVLVYHRLGSRVPDSCKVVPTLRVELFRSQLQALGEVADLVSLDEILTTVPGRGRAGRLKQRVRVAVTFDDDLPSHVAEALPVLQELRVPAAFFLSGRALHGLGPYWFQRLEALLATYGEARSAELLGVPRAFRPGSLARLCEQDPALRQRLTEVQTKAPLTPILQADGIAALGNAGMTIGFHTVDHRVLPDLNDQDLTIAVSHGRIELSTCAGTAVRYFAYPHGKTDGRACDAVRAALFEAAFTGQPKPLRPSDDRYSLGRWEPGPRGADDLLVNLAVRLHRAAPQLPLVS